MTEQASKRSSSAIAKTKLIVKSKLNIDVVDGGIKLPRSGNNNEK